MCYLTQQAPVASSGSALSSRSPQAASLIARRSATPFRSPPMAIGTVPSPVAWRRGKDLDVPPQELDEIAAFASEREQRARMRVLRQNFLRHHRQPVEAAPHVGRAASKKNAPIRRKRNHRAPSASSTRFSAFVSTPPLTRTRTPVGSAISIRQETDGAPRAVSSEASSDRTALTRGVIDAEGASATSTRANAGPGLGALSAPFRIKRRHV
jgi:hypothetical protein